MSSNPPWADFFSFLHGNVQKSASCALWLRGDGKLKDKKSRKADELLKMLAASSPNDAVKLLFLGEEDLSLLDGLDLSLISEIKRNPNGTVEMKFVDKLAVLHELLELKKSDEKQNAEGKSIFDALDKASKVFESEEKPD